MAWYRDTFNQDYLDLYSPTLDGRTPMELGFLEPYLKPGAKVLDVCCGNGRHSVPLAQAGYKVTGVDINRLMVKRARQRARDAQADVRWLEADVRQLPYRNEFDLAICLYHSFGYFEDEEDNFRLGRAVARALKPGAHLVLDWVGMQALPGYVGEHRVETPEFLFEEKVEHQPPYLIIDQIVTPPDARPVRFHHRLRMFEEKEMGALARSLGLAWVQSWGGFDRCPTYEGDRLIALFVKPASPQSAAGDSSP